jgi:hypothetical protein
MDNDGKQKNLESNSPQQYISNVSDASTFFQSFWIRCNTIFSDIVDRKFMESQFRHVFYCGLISWFIFLLSKVF